MHFFFFFQAEDGIRAVAVTGVQTCALPILPPTAAHPTNPLKSVIVEGSAPVAGRNTWNSGPEGPSNCSPPGMGRGVAEVVVLRPKLIDAAPLSTAARETPVSRPEPARAPRVRLVFSRNPLRLSRRS